MTEQIKKIETLFGLEEGSINKLASGEEVEIDFTKVRPSSDFDTLKANMEKEFTDKDEDRKNIYRKEGIETEIKRIRKKNGWEFEGKNFENLLEANNKHLEAERGVDVDERLKTKDADILGLQDTVKGRDTRILELEAENKGIAQKFVDKENSAILNAALDSEYVKYKDKTLFEQSDLSDLFKLNNKASFVDGDIVYLDDKGDVRKDEMSTPLTTSDVYEGFMTTRLKKATGGNTDNEGADPSGSRTIQQVQESMIKQGKSTTEIHNEVNRLSKEGLIK